MIVELTPGKSVEMESATGYTELVALSIQAKIGPLLTEFEGLLGNAYYITRFCQAMAITKACNGFDFTLPDPRAPAEELADCYRAWLKLPKKLWRKWFDAADDNAAIWNAPDLAPGGDTDVSPLAYSVELSKQPS